MHWFYHLIPFLTKATAERSSHLRDWRGATKAQMCSKEAVTEGHQRSQRLTWKLQLLVNEAKNFFSKATSLKKAKTINAVKRCWNVLIWLTTNESSKVPALQIFCSDPKQAQRRNAQIGIKTDPTGHPLPRHRFHPFCLDGLRKKRELWAQANSTKDHRAHNVELALASFPNPPRDLASLWSRSIICYTLKGKKRLTQGSWRRSCLATASCQQASCQRHLWQSLMTVKYRISQN